MFEWDYPLWAMPFGYGWGVASQFFLDLIYVFYWIDWNKIPELVQESEGLEITQP
jgi:hypothetical protein